MTRLRSAFLVAGLSVAATFVLALPQSVEAGARGCNCAAGHPAVIRTAAHASAHASAAVHIQAAAYSHAGGYAVHTGGYGMRGAGESHDFHYPTHVMHDPARYPGQTETGWRGGAHSGGYAVGGYDRRGYERHRYGGNSYAFVYTPAYNDSGYAADYSGSDGYAAAMPATYDTGDYPSYGYAGYGGGYAGTDDGYDNVAPPLDDDYEAAPQPYLPAYADTGYSNATYSDASYADTAYAPPPAYGYDDAVAASVQGWRDGDGGWHCGPSSGGTIVTAYGFRDQYGEWHVTSETSRTHYSYSYSY